MNYGLLRKGLIDAISFDAISVKRELLQEYFYRLDEMQNNSESKDTARKVVLDFYDKYVKGRTYKVRMNGKVYLLVTTQKTREKLMIFDQNERQRPLLQDDEATAYLSS